MMAKAVHIVGWVTRYEVSQSRSVERLGWGPKPVDRISRKRDRVLARPDGLQIWAMFDLIWTLCCQAPKGLRGYAIAEDGDILQPADIARCYHQDPAFVQH